MKELAETLEAATECCEHEKLTDAGVKWATFALRNLTGEHLTCPKCTIEQPCEVYSRIVGYLRPIDQWNKGKQEEFKQDYITGLVDKKSVSPDNKLLRKEFLNKLISKNLSPFEQKIIYY